MLGPEPFDLDDPRLLAALTTRPLWRVDPSGDSAPLERDSARRAAALDALRQASQVIARRSHQRIWGPVVGLDRVGDGVWTPRLLLELDLRPRSSEGVWDRTTAFGLAQIDVAAPMIVVGLRAIEWPDPVAEVIAAELGRD